VKAGGKKRGRGVDLGRKGKLLADRTEKKGARIGGGMWKCLAPVGRYKFLPEITREKLESVGYSETEIGKVGGDIRRHEKKL